MEELIALRGVRYARGRLADWVAEVGRIAMMLWEAVRNMPPALRRLRLISDQMSAIGVFGGFIVAITAIGVSSNTYMTGVKQYFYLKDLYSGLLKSMFFGGIIGTMGCFYGFATEGGAEGVGIATTRAVVASCVLVLVSDYVLANVLFRLIFAS